MDNLCAHLGWGETYKRRPSGELLERYGVHIPAMKNEAQTFRLECMTNARIIHEMATALHKRVVLFVSGGMDSHSMLLSFALQKLEVHAVVYRVLIDGHVINRPDFEGGINICSKYGVSVHVEDVVLDDYKTRPEYLTQTEYHHQKDLGLYLRKVVADRYLDDFVVQVGDLHTFGYMPETCPWDFVAIFKPFNPSSTMFNQRQHGVSCFHQFRTESMMSYLEAVFKYSTINRLNLMYPSFEYVQQKAWPVSLKGGVKFYEYLFKPQVFGREWPEMEVQPKLTGFEDGPIDFTTDEDAIDLTTIQLYRSIAIPVNQLISRMRTGAVFLESSAAACPRLSQFKKQEA